MKREHKFIEDMWKQVEQTELEVLENKRALQISKRLLWKEMLIFLILIIITVIIIGCFCRYGSGAVYLGAFLLIGMAYIADTYVISRA